MTTAANGVPIRHAVFDLGGVTCRYDQERRLRLLADAYDLEPADVEQRLWGSGYVRACDDGTYSREQSYAQAAAALGKDLGADRFRELWMSAFEPDAEVLAAIDRIRATVQTALLTDNGHVVKDAFALEFRDTAAHFDHLLLSCDLGAVKPSGTLFGRATDRLGAEPAAVVLFDDSADNVAGANRAGWRGVLFTDSASLAADLDRLALAERGAP